MDYTDQTTVIIGVIISNAVALTMFYLSWKKIAMARLFFFLLFSWAAITNMFTAIYSPSHYLEYADFAILPIYRDFILGFFSRHITTLVLLVASCQLIIAISMLLKGNTFKLGCVGGMIFLISILPLGFGSGSPAPLIWCVALYILFKKNVQLYWWKSLRSEASVNDD